jgi:hypothetical protein
METLSVRTRNLSNGMNSIEEPLVDVVNRDGGPQTLEDDLDFGRRPGRPDNNVTSRIAPYSEM